jgi:uncharacterized protein YgiM (DUF1202 family)
MRAFVRLITFVVVLCAVVLSAAQPTQAQDPYNRCRDAQGNEICTHYYEIDGRVNPNDAMASVTAYCQPDLSMQIYGVNGAIGEYLFTVSAQQLADGVATANASGAAVSIGAASGREIAALPGDLLQISGGSYLYQFSASFCGTLPPGNVIGGRARRTPRNTGNTGNTAASTPSPEAVVATNNGIVVTIREGLNVRATPSLRGTVLTVVQYGDSLNVEGRDRRSRWLKVNQNGYVGWVYAQFTSIGTAISELPVVQ